MESPASSAGASAHQRVDQGEVELASAARQAAGKRGHNGRSAENQGNSDNHRKAPGPGNPRGHREIANRRDGDRRRCRRERAGHEGQDAR